MRRARLQYLTVLRADGTPHRVALGVALGTIAGFLPIVPFQTVTSLALCFIFRGSFVASIPTIQITNPLTIPPFYYLFYKLGQSLSQYGHSQDLPPVRELMSLDLAVLWARFSDVFLAMMVGGLFLAAVFAPLFYLLTRRYLFRLRRRAYSRLKCVRLKMPAVENGEA